ncbi:hypothetical protein HanPSC8_Chr15g0664151 [Helianthus annuus]|nr:hypothetical protein HanPSC8_Chr15g0664151 [Helianthus annuus]
MMATGRDERENGERERPDARDERERERSEARSDDDSDRRTTAVTVQVLIQVTERRRRRRRQAPAVGNCQRLWFGLGCSLGSDLSPRSVSSLGIRVCLELGQPRLAWFIPVRARLSLVRVHVKTHQIRIRFSFGSCSVGPVSVSGQTWLTFGQAGSTSQTRGWGDLGVPSF